MFSVIIPLYNKEKSIKNTLNSVISQTYKTFEIIIVNDGSTDDSLEMACKIKDKRIKIITTANQGVSNARNLGVEQAKYNFIAFLDADDIWHSNHLENLKNTINHFPENKWYATAYEIRHNRHLTLPINSPAMEKETDFSLQNFFSNSIIDSIVWTSAVCFEKSFFNNLGGFDTTLRNNQDTDLWIRAGIKQLVAFSKLISATYLHTTENRISTKKTTIKTIMDFDKYEKYISNNPSLKKYLDLNRYSVAVRYKSEGNMTSFKYIYKKIKKENISKKQYILLQLPSFILRLLFKCQSIFIKYGLRIRTA